MNQKAFLWLGLGIIVVGAGILIFSNRRAANLAEDAGRVETEEVRETSVTTEGEIVLGAIYPLTGDGSVFGIPLQKAAELAVDEININGGIDGKKVVIRYENGECEADKAKTAAAKLISVDNVPLIFGGICSSESLGMAEAINGAKRPAISPSASNIEITKLGGAYTFRLVPSDADVSRAAARFAYGDLGARKAAVLAERTAYPAELQKGFIKAFEDQGGKVLLDESWGAVDTDFQEIAQKVKNAGIDVVYLAPQTAASGVAIMKALRDREVEAVTLASEALFERATVAGDAVLLEGVYGFEIKFDEEDEVVKSFLEAYEIKYREKASFPLYMANAYSSVYLAEDLIEAHGMNGEAIQVALAELTSWSGGALRDVTFDENGDIEWRTYQVKVIKNGEAVNHEARNNEQ